MDNNQNQSQNNQAGETTSLKADKNWQDFSQPVGHIKSPVGCEIEFNDDGTGRIKSLETSEQGFDVSYLTADNQTADNS